MRPASLLPGYHLVQNGPFDEIEHVVDAVLPSKDQAGHLRTGTTDPFLPLTRRTWTHTTPVTMARCLHRSLALSAGQPLR